MAIRSFLASIDLNNNQLFNPVIHNYGDNATLPASTIAGKIIYHTNGSTRELYIHDGANWLKIPSGTVSATEGGTGFSSYTIGDILYASGTDTLSKLAGVGTGNALISGGIGTAPSWGKISLTSHVSGILPVGNGGTGANTFASGEALIGAGTGAITTRGITNNTSSFTAGAASTNLITYNTLINYTGSTDLDWNVNTVILTNSTTVATLSVDTTSPGFLKVDKGFYSEGAISAYGISGGGGGGAGLVTSIDSWAYINAQATNPYATDAGSTIVANAYTAYETLARVKALEAGSATNIVDGTITGALVTSITKSGSDIIVNKQEISSSDLYGSLTDPTGSGLAVFGTSPTFTTSILSSATFTAFAASSTLSLGYAGTSSSTLNVSTGATVSASTKLVNIGTGSAAGSITQINLGTNTASSYVTIHTPTLNFNGTDIVTTATSTTLNIFNTNLQNVNAFGAATSITLGATSGNATIRNATITFSNATTININGTNPTLASSSTGTLTLFNTNLATITAFGAATTLTLGGITATSTATLAGGATISGSIKTVNVGTGGVSGSTTNINIGSLASTTTVNLNGNASVSGNLLVSGNLTVDGVVTSINSSTLTVDDKNIELGAVVTQAGLKATLATGTSTITLTTGTTSGLIVGQKLTKTGDTGVFGNGSGLTVSWTGGTGGAIPSTVTIAAAGAGYSVGDIVTVGGGTGGTITITNVNPTTFAVTAISLTTGGTGYGAAITGATTTVTTNNGPTITSIISLTQFTVNVNHATSGLITFSVSGATDVTADGGGITLKGATDKTILWDKYNQAWSLSENLNIAASKYYRVGGINLFTITGTEIIAGSTITNIKLGTQVLTRKYTGNITGGVQSFEVLHSLANVVAQVVDVSGTLIECEVVTSSTKTTFNFNSNTPSSGTGPYRYIIIG